MELKDSVDSCPAIDDLSFEVGHHRLALWLDYGHHLYFCPYGGWYGSISFLLSSVAALMN